MAFAINGKFTAQRITGVQRVAYELTRAVQSGGFRTDDIEIVVPKNAIQPGASLKSKRCCPWLIGNLWEQIALPLSTSGETLISLCNTSPLFKRRQIVMVHDMAVFDVPHAFSKKFRMWYRLVFAMMHRNAEMILTVSEFSKTRICHHLKLDESRVSVIRPGIDHLEWVVSDPAVLTRLNLTHGKYCLLVGSLDPRKNLHRVLDAVKRLAHLSDVRFVVVGGANPRVFNSQAHVDEGESSRVTWAGFVDDGELKALYENAATLVFPSLYEGFGLPPLEAMYCGCPVIVSHEASLPEICGDAALYCDATSVDDIADKIALMLGDGNLRAHYRELGLSHACQYRWDRAARELLEVLSGDAKSAIHVHREAPLARR
jgi:glycosyltransferase involved in cell wall biosynthesis